MATFQDIQTATKDKTKLGAAYVDHATPEGHFGVIANILGLTRTYLLKGEFDSPDAVIKGVIVTDRMNRSNMYKGSNLMGGRHLGNATSYEESFGRFM